MVCASLQFHRGTFRTVLIGPLVLRRSLKFRICCGISQVLSVGNQVKFEKNALRFRQNTPWKHRRQRQAVLTVSAESLVFIASSTPGRQVSHGDPKRRRGAGPECRVPKGGVPYLRSWLACRLRMGRWREDAPRAICISSLFVVKTNQSC